jgi:TetR/AcrR family acrAB operon transcriptional repressor
VARRAIVPHPAQIRRRKEPDRMVRRTKEEALETRDRILDTAEQLFSEKGVSGTSLADIADAAGVTRGAIYWHFKNKQDLFSAMLDRVALPMEEMVRRAAEEGAHDPLDALRTCCIYVLQQTASNARCRRVFSIVAHKCEYVKEQRGLVKRELQCRSQVLAMIERALRNATRRGTLAPHVDIRRTAIGLQAYVDGLIHNWLFNPDGYSLEREAEALMDLYFEGLKATVRPVIGGRKMPAATARRTVKAL